MCMYACKHEYVYTKTVTHAYEYTRRHLSLLPSLPLLITRAGQGAQGQPARRNGRIYIDIDIDIYIHTQVNGGVPGAQGQPARGNGRFRPLRYPA